MLQKHKTLLGGSKLIELWNLKFIRKRIRCIVVILQPRENLCIAVMLRAESWWVD